ncbi:hypothetical protein [Parapedobacter koreensis]|uniref:Uncharacterized protein n=1 Tax=Parapedobacter koreensis TaxID=332977 RepID=A0A1H7UDR4_9SPHI|nr:hypothetical protein [Parapedobacter koreensis]SEL95143.1 hypothetical protein SAMN05421740_11513 [Parapedobacter koreensis]
MRFIDSDGQWPNPILNALVSITKVKVREAINQFAFVAKDMKPIDAKSTGKDIARMSMGAEKDGVGTEVYVRMDSKGDIGMGLKAGVSTLPGKGTASAEYVENIAGGEPKVNTETSVELNGTALPEVPNLLEEVGIKQGAVTVNVNPKEAVNVLHDAYKSVQEYFKTAVEKIVTPNKKPDENP